MSGVPGRGWIRILAACAVLLVVAFVVQILTFAAFGFLLYGAVVLLVGVWNAWVTTVWVQSWRSRSPRTLVGLPLVFAILSAFATVAWSALVLTLFSGGKGVLLVAYLVAFAESLVVFRASAVRSRRDVVLPIYNFAGTVFLATWAAQESWSGLGALELPVHALTRDVATFQTLHFFALAGFLPIFLVPPILAKPKGLRRWSGDQVVVPAYRSAFLSRPRVDRFARTVSQLLGLWSVYTVVALLVFALPSAQSVASFHGLPAPSGAAYAVDENLTFSVVLGSLTDVVAPPPNYRDLVRREAALAAALRVDAVRFDLKTELIRSAEGIAALDWAAAELRGQGFRLVLSPFGRDAWTAAKPTYESLNATIHEDAVFLAGASVRSGSSRSSSRTDRST